MSGRAEVPGDKAGAFDSPSAFVARCGSPDRVRGAGVPAPPVVRPPRDRPHDRRPAPRGGARPRRRGGHPCRREGRAAHGGGVGGGTPGPLLRGDRPVAAGHDRVGRHRGRGMGGPRPAAPQRDARHRSADRRVGPAGRLPRGGGGGRFGHGCGRGADGRGGDRRRCGVPWLGGRRRLGPRGRRALRHGSEGPCGLALAPGRRVRGHHRRQPRLGLVRLRGRRSGLAGLPGLAVHRRHRPDLGSRQAGSRRGRGRRRGDLLDDDSSDHGRRRNLRAGGCHSLRPTPHGRGLLHHHGSDRPQPGRAARRTPAVAPGDHGRPPIHDPDRRRLRCRHLGQVLSRDGAPTRGLRAGEPGSGPSPRQEP